MVRAIACLDDSRVVTASENTLRVWNVETGKIPRILKGHTGLIYALARLDSRRVVSASADRTLRIWDVETGQTLRTLTGHADWVIAVAYIGAGLAVSASFDRTLRVWDVETGLILHFLEGHTKKINDVARLDDRRIVSASADCTVRVWEVDTGTSLAMFTLESEASVIATMSDARTIVVGDASGRLHFLLLEEDSARSGFDDVGIGGPRGAVKLSLHQMAEEASSAVSPPERLGDLFLKVFGADRGADLDLPPRELDTPMDLEA
jgi:WD40 repeat protein